MPANRTMAGAHESDCEDSVPMSLSFRDIATAGRDPSALHRALSSPPDSFQFFCAASEMCSAEDVFLGWRLLPLNPRSPLPGTLPLDHRRSGSLDRRHYWPGGLADKHRKLRRAASDPPTEAMKPQPRWYLFVLGPMRVPSAMQMEDIRTRQRRRRTPSPEDTVGRLSNGRRGPWRLLRSLSCNGAESAAVLPSPVRFTSHLRA
ncbi:unnamed protein product [Musa hybrid cultivar]